MPEISRTSQPAAPDIEGQSRLVRTRYNLLCVLSKTVTQTHLNKTTSAVLQFLARSIPIGTRLAGERVVQRRRCAQHPAPRRDESTAFFSAASPINATSRQAESIEPESSSTKSSHQPRPSLHGITSDGSFVTTPSTVRRRFCGDFCPQTVPT